MRFFGFYPNEQTFCCICIGSLLVVCIGTIRTANNTVVYISYRMRFFAFAFFLTAEQYAKQLQTATYFYNPILYSINFTNKIHFFVVKIQF